MSGQKARSPQLGAALALGAVAAAVAALPDVRRVAGGVASPGVAWLALAGNTALVLGPLLALSRAAPARVAAFRTAVVGALFAAVPVALLGQLLKTHTHHRPLGAATFGVLALVLVLASMLVASRLTAWVARHPSTLRRGLLGVVIAAALAGLGLLLLRALASDGMHHGVIEALRLLSAGILARMALDQPRVEQFARRLGGPVWVGLVAAGLLSARGPLRDSIRENAPLLGGPLTWL